MADSEATEIRSELRRLGSRRATQEKREAELSDDIEAALRRAYGVVSISEAARLLGLHRTSIYRVYRPHEHAA